MNISHQQQTNLNARLLPRTVNMHRGGEIRGMGLIQDMKSVYLAFDLVVQGLGMRCLRRLFGLLYLVESHWGPSVTWGSNPSLYDYFLPGPLSIVQINISFSIQRQRQRYPFFVPLTTLKIPRHHPPNSTNTLNIATPPASIIICIKTLLIAYQTNSASRDHLKQSIA